jgi:hypothetical protein
MDDDDENIEAAAASVVERAATAWHRHPPFEG